VASDKKFFEQLNTFTIGDNPASTVQLLSNPVHIQSSNKEVLDAIIQVNRAGMRDGSAIPGTSIIQTTTVTDNTRTVLFAPSRGEVWVLNTAGAVTSGASSANYTMYLNDGTNLLAFFYDASDDATVFFTDDANWGPITIDENIRIEGIVGGSVTSAKWQLNMYRIR
tara:strand:+ start:403 stop:903 length:501 start_codon:yes stop_codon:yes gene_type:complete